MDVGKQVISLSVIVPEPSSGADSEDPLPDLLDIYYSKQTCTHTSMLTQVACHFFSSFRKCVIGTQLQVLFPADCTMPECLLNLPLGIDLPFCSKQHALTNAMHNANCAQNCCSCLCPAPLCTIWQKIVRHRVSVSCFTAGNVSSMVAKALPGNDSRYVHLKLSLKEVPDILLDHFGAQDK